MICFSIITVTYDAQATLQRTLDSVAGQHYDGIEYIVVDGASNDNTLAMVENMRGRMESGTGRSMKVISEPDRGLYDAMNKGMKIATGDYVLFMNAGDTLASSDTLALVSELAYKARIGDMLPGVIYGDTDIVDAGNHFVGKRNHRPPEVLTWRSFQDGMLVCHQAMYVRNDIAQRTPYDLKYRFSSDVDWCIRVMKETERLGLPLVNAHEVLCNFLAGGLTISNHKESLKERFSIMAKHYGVVKTVCKHLKFLKRIV